MRHLVYSPFGGNNGRRLTEIGVKIEKIYKYFFHDCLETLLLVLTSLKMRKSFKNDQFVVEIMKISI